MSEGNMSLPPRHIRRYPTASTTSSSSSTAGPGSLEETGEEEVFLKYESCHTITRHFHCHGAGVSMWRYDVNGASEKFVAPKAVFVAPNNTFQS